MRLACPNCDAKYEVPDDAIPDTGRDVQCSACGHAWFQMRPEAEAAAEEEAALYGDDLPPPAAEPAAQAAPAVMDRGAEPDGDEDGDEDPAPRRAPAEAMTPVLEDSVLAVLREEAEREAETRRQEAQRAAARTAEAEGQMQTQPDLGMEAPPAPAMTATQRRLAMLKGEDPDAAPAAPMKPPARRDLLPDVEEINSTLQPGENAGGEDDVDALPDLTKRGSGFRTGFFLALFLLAVAAVVYVAAPSIGASVPALEGVMNGYVGAVDGLRVWLNDLLSSASDTLNPGG